MESRLQLPDGAKFGTVLADPPWPQGGKHTLGIRRRIHYDRMTLEEIKEMPVGDATHRDGHLWLWTTSHHMKVALEVVEAWGFEFRTFATWPKNRMGIGWWLRSKTEHIIFAAKTRRLRRNPGNETSIIEGKQRGHSVKPETIYPKIERLSPGPYLELFARTFNERENWLCLGSNGDPQNPFGQKESGQLETEDGEIRGIGGFLPEPEMRLVYLQKVLVPVEVEVVKVSGRRIQISVPENGGATKKTVSIDKLRTLDYGV